MLNLTTKDMAMVGMLSALAVAMGYAFIFVPNIEMVSATIFISGYFLGVPKGILVGVIAESIYSAFNPMGSGLAFPYLFAAQIMGMSLFGAVGGFVSTFGEKNVFSKGKIVAFAVSGFICTSIFDILTTLSWPIAAGFEGNQIFATIALGAIFVSIHILSNTIIFAVAVPSILKAVIKSGRFA